MPPFPPTRLLASPIALLATAVVGALAASQQVEASIQGIDLGPDLCSQSLDPADLEKTLKRLSEPADAMGAKSSRQANPKSAVVWPPEPQNDKSSTPQYALLQSPGNTSSSTTTSSSTGSATSGVGLALFPAAAPQLTDNSLTERYAAECTLFLPNAPANELLRPPQV